MPNCDVVVVDCVTCGRYEPTPDELRTLVGRTFQQGWQCFRCNNEVDVLLDGVRTYHERLRDRFRELL